MTLPDDVKEQLERFEAALGSVERGLEPLLAADRRELEAHLTPVERAKVHITLANAVSTLFCSASPTLDPATGPRGRRRPASLTRRRERSLERPTPADTRISSPLSSAVYLKAVGLDPAEHAVRRELERVDLYRAKVDKAASGERRAARVDTAAAADSSSTRWETQREARGTSGGRQRMGKRAERRGKAWRGARRARRREETSVTFERDARAHAG